MVSVSWRPMVYSGFSEVSGSWKMAPMLAPADGLRICFVRKVVDASAFEQDLAASDAARRLQQADDGRASERSCRRRTRPPRPAPHPGAMSNVDVVQRQQRAAPGREFDAQVASLRAEGGAISAQSWVRCVAQPVAQQVHAQRDQHQHRAGEDRDPPFAGKQEVVADADQRAQRRRWSAAHRRPGTTAWPRSGWLRPPGSWPAPAPAPARWAAHGLQHDAHAAPRRSRVPPARIPCCARPGSLPRTVRAYWTQPVSEIAMHQHAEAPALSCALGKMARPTPSISSATRIDGNAQHHVAHAHDEGVDLAAR